MRSPLILTLLALASPAAAERAAFTCDFTTRCGDDGCGPNVAQYVFRYDTDTGMSEMLADGQTYPMTHEAMAGMDHFVLVNDGGAELITILGSGAVTYSGHMDFAGDPTWYRLEGTCATRRK